MAQLRGVDQVAYVRFASVYRKFEDVSTFIEDTQALQKELQTTKAENKQNCG